DRAAHAAANAMALAAARNLRNDPVVLGPDDVFKNPGHGAPPIKRKGGRSYPVFVDPWGRILGSATVADLAPGIPRQTVSWVDQAGGGQQVQNILKGFTLTEDMKFIQQGAAKGLANHGPWEPVERHGRYSWAYLLHRPQAWDASMVDLSVVVYNGRLLELPLRETPYGPVTFNPATNTVLVQWDPKTQEKPPVRKGGWI